MSPCKSVVDQIRRAGGVLRLKGGHVKCWLPKEAAHLVEELRANKPELVALLRARGGRIANFPTCPRCCSYALYRKDNLGAYECMTCGRAGIEEHAARRVM